MSDRTAKSAHLRLVKDVPAPPPPAGHLRAEPYVDEFCMLLERMLEARLSASARRTAAALEHEDATQFALLHLVIAHERDVSAAEMAAAEMAAAETRAENEALREELEWNKQALVIERAISGAFEEELTRRPALQAVQG